MDGQNVQVIKDFQGDVLKPANSFIWIQSIRAVIAGDLVFENVHPWLADSDAQTRTAWLHSLDLISALHPRVVVARHKKNAELPDTTDTIAFMRNYLQDFDATRKTAPNAEAFAAAIKQRYPDLGQKRFVDFAAKAAYAAASHQSLDSSMSSGENRPLVIPSRRTAQAPVRKDDTIRQHRASFSLNRPGEGAEGG